MMKLLITGLIIAAAYSSFKYLYKPAKVLLPKYSYLSCQGSSFDSKVSLQSSFYLLANAVPTEVKDLNSLALSGSYVQNLYTFTNVSGMNPNGAVKWSSLGGKPKIKITKIEDDVYPYNSEFEKDLPLIGMPPQMVLYLKKVLALGKISKGAPAKKVTYEYENDFKICLTENSFEMVKKISFIQPIDPFMAYFVIPLSQRRTMNNAKLKSTWTVNPCLNIEALSSQGVAPFAYWYHWNPKIEGRDFNKETFDCSLFYQEGKSIQNVQVILTEAEPKKVKDLDFEKFSGLERPLKISVHYGPQDGTNFYPLDAKVEDYINLYMRKIDLQQAKTNLPNVKGEKYDIVLAKMLIFLWSLNQHFDVVNKKITIQPNHATVTLQGKLRLSKQDIEIVVTFANNSPGVEGTDYFDKLFAEDLLSKDILIYDGHSSYGGIFSNVFEEVKKVSEDKVNTKYQILALYSCSSGHYFGAENFKKIKTPGFRRDIISTGGGYQDITSNASLALISSLDSYLYNERNVPFSLWAKSFKTDNFFILEND